MTLMVVGLIGYLHNYSKLSPVCTLKDKEGAFDMWHYKVVSNNALQKHYAHYEKAQVPRTPNIHLEFIKAGRQ